MLSKRLLQRHISHVVNARSIIAPTRGSTPILSRFELKRRVEDPTYARDQEVKREIEKREEMERFHFNLKGNDSNPENRIKKLRIKSLNAHEVVAPIPEANNPDVIYYRSEPPRLFVTGRLGRTKGSIKKIAPVMRKVRGLQIDEAIQVAENLPQGAAKRMVSGLKMVKDHALNKGMNLMRLYVKDAITNRFKRFKSLRYHAKGKIGRQESDWCTLYFKLEEKPAREFFKDIVGGKATASVANFWKEKVLSSSNPLEDIRKLQFVLTARGRAQRREMIRRKAFSLQQDLLVGFIDCRKKVALYHSLSFS